MGCSSYISARAGATRLNRQAILSSAALTSVTVTAPTRLTVSQKTMAKRGPGLGSPEGRLSRRAGELFSFRGRSSQLLLRRPLCLQPEARLLYSANPSASRRSAVSPRRSLPRDQCQMPHRPSLPLLDRQTPPHVSPSPLR